MVNPDSGAVTGGVATLGFAYTRNAVFVPDLVRQSPFQLTLRSIVLTELSQGASAAELERTSQPPAALAPEAWTLLIWTVNKCVFAHVVAVVSAGWRQHRHCRLATLMHIAAGIL